MTSLAVGGLAILPEVLSEHSEFSMGETVANVFLWAQPHPSTLPVISPQQTEWLLMQGICQ